MLPVAENFPINVNGAILVRQQIVNCGRGFREEVEIRLRRRARRVLLFRSGLRHSAPREFTLAANRHARSLACVLREFRDISRALVPRIQQQAGAREHVAGEKFLEPAFEDVAILVADLTSC